MNMLYNALRRGWLQLEVSNWGSPEKNEEKLKILQVETQTGNKWHQIAAAYKKPHKFHAIHSINLFSSIIHSIHDRIIQNTNTNRVE